MRFDQYFSEEAARKNIILQSVKGKEDTLIACFIEEGPEKLREKLCLYNDYDWQILFDYLVFEHHVLKVCVLKYADFFQNLVRYKGPQAFRQVFGIEHGIYDEIFEEIFDLMVISTGILFQYVSSRSQELLKKIKEGKGSELRNTLGLAKKKYNPTWQKVLELLYESFGEDLIFERILEQGIQSFSFLMDASRGHAAL